MIVRWSAPSRDYIGFHPSERSVVWENPATGEVRYPPRNDVPIPTRYRDQGFQRRELSSLREVHQFEKEKKVLSEKAWFDQSGRSFDGDYKPGRVSPETFREHIRKIRDDGR